MQQTETAADAATPPGLGEITRVFARIGVLSFGGPAAQIALMHRELVDERPWLSERQYLSALSFCMLLPGPEAMQLATYAGWRLRGVRGGLIAGFLFVAPGAAVMMALAAAYVAFGTLPAVEAAFLGIKAAVVVIVLQALLNVGKRALSGTAHWVLAVLSFAAIYAFGAPFPLIVLAAGIYGYLTARPDMDAGKVATPPAYPWRTITIWLALWWGPVAAMAALGATRLTEIGLFFSTLAVVTFGGAYAVLAYMTQSVVEVQGWLETAQMMDGLGLAETTPGPLILVTQFVGYLAGAQAGMAVAGALVALWVTFVPCFLWIFSGAPYIEWISTQARLAAALRAITAAVVGVILNLSLWFALHVFFARIDQLDLGPASILVPDAASVDPAAVALAVLAFVLLIVLGRGLALTLLLVSGAGLIIGLS